MDEGGMVMKEKKQIQLSYESDGKMGEQRKEKNSKKKHKEFFNTTPSSE
jgi:hypothetical protein